MMWRLCHFESQRGSYKLENSDSYDCEISELNFSGKASESDKIAACQKLIELYAEARYFCYRPTPIQTLYGIILMEVK